MCACAEYAEMGDEEADQEDLPLLAGQHAPPQQQQPEQQVRTRLCAASFVISGISRTRRKGNTRWQSGWCRARLWQTLAWLGWRSHEEPRLLVLMPRRPNSAWMMVQS